MTLTVAKPAKSTAKQFETLKDHLTQFAKLLFGLHAHHLREELEEAAKTENVVVGDTKAVLKVINQRYDVLAEHSEKVFELLNALKASNSPSYLPAYKMAYDEINAFAYDIRFHDDYSSSTSGTIEPENVCLNFLYSVIGEQLIRPSISKLLSENLPDFNAAFNLPDSFTDTKTYIAKALYEMELMLTEKIKKMDYYNLPRALEKFNSLRYKYENKPKEALILLDKYFEAMQVVYALSETALEDGDDDLVNEEGEFKDKVLWEMNNDLRYMYDVIHQFFTEDESDYFTQKQDKSVLDILDVDIEEEANDVPFTIPEKTTLDKTLTTPNINFILEMLEALKITVNGKAEVSERKKSALRGVVEASLEKNLLPPKSINASCIMIASQIGLELRSKLNSTYTSKTYREKALRYIEQYHKTE